MSRHLLLIFVLILAGFSVAHAADFDPYLHQKAEDYTDWLIQWHSSGLGGVSDVLFTDETRTEMLRTWGGGDSTDWTATYLVSQAVRYLVTGEPQARDEVIRIAEYLHVVHDITGDPGYLARYAGPNEPPWNVEHGDCSNGVNCYEGEGDYEGDFWIGHQSRDKYMHWYWALTWAWLAVDDPDMRATIQEDFVSVLETLIANNWTIVDPWGDTWPAAEIGPDLRLAFLLQTATVTGDPKWWAELDAEYERDKYYMWVSTIAFFNKYFDYYAFINSQAVWQPIFMLWPDRPRLEHLVNIWHTNNRKHTANTHNPFFDAIYVQACNRLGGCPQDELDYIEQDAYVSLVDMNEAPNYQRKVTCTDLPLDPFSVWADNFLAQFPWVEQLTGFDIDPQTADAHEVWDRCWASVLWERSPYHITCDKGDDPAHVTHGMDYLIAYWLGVYYGFVDGDGPYGDDDLTDDDDDDDNDTGDDDDDDDNNDDNDTGDDDAAGDDDSAGDDQDDDDDACCG